MRSSAFFLAVLVGVASAGMPGGPSNYQTGKYHHKPTGSGIGPTGSGVGPTGSGVGPTGTGSPSTTGPPTTTVTHTSDVPSKLPITDIRLTRTNTHTRHNDLYTLRHYDPYVYNHQIRALLESHCHSWSFHVLLDLVDHHLFHHYRHPNQYDVRSHLPVHHQQPHRNRLWQWLGCRQLW